MRIPSQPTKRNQAIMSSSTVLESNSITNINNTNEDAGGCLCVASAAVVAGVAHDEEDDKQAREMHDTLLRWWR